MRTEGVGLLFVWCVGGTPVNADPRRGCAQPGFQRLNGHYQTKEYVTKGNTSGVYRGTSQADYQGRSIDKL